ncbi:MAG: hypothetical protein AAGI71_08335 [Bacteroidota bacterium]
MKLFPLLVCACALLAAGCSSPQDNAVDADHLPRADHAELAELHRQDQAGRMARPIDWDALVVEDRERRRRVQELLDADSVVTAADYFHAAMIFQHGADSTAYRKAHELAQRSVELDSTNGVARWLTAASWDRYLISIGEPQWYGTQSLTLDGTTYLRRIDTTRVSDPERQRLGVETLSEIRTRLTEANGADRGLWQLPDSIRVKVRG